ncbi:methyl-accepting chemotaxis protein [Alteromonas sp. KUL49]|uniref:methyl-accepting chemotaxis protein n=1 Tax=Alteromonas sp. KUL49 TaxID=2480798 RepID=UPI00102EED2A|nr:methyl-accepting chemotaxis protein [Alteromonas sp. KUL49]TAP42401.1 chemotaxis protein [Alteromonas sp. KUL49]GEA10020.1 chemotaxis protein [Alteromonas sp. KUL49]
MFVSSTRYEQKEAELAQLKRDHQETLSRMRELEADNTALQRQIDEAESTRSGQNASVLMQCVIDSLKQISTIRDTVLAAYEQIDAENHSIADINQLFSQSSGVLEKIVQDMSGLNTQMGSMSERISGLSTTADNINKFVTTITSISDQTNLLALNAAIEAARAGDAGRGFSVVADEVRALATETNKSATEVSELVNGIIQSTQQAVSGVNELRSNNEELEGGINTLNTSYDEMVTHCDSMRQTIGDGTQRTFIQTVKLDNVVWKSEVYAVLCGQSEQSISEFSDHSSSRLGQWHSANAGKPVSQTSAYRELDGVSRSVYENGIEALKAHQKGDQAAVESRIVAMERASERVLSLLDSLA